MREKASEFARMFWNVRELLRLRHKAVIGIQFFHVLLYMTITWRTILFRNDYLMQKFRRPLTPHYAFLRAAVGNISNRTRENILEDDLVFARFGLVHYKHLFIDIKFIILCIILLQQTALRQNPTVRR